MLDAGTSHSMFLHGLYIVHTTQVDFSNIVSSSSLTMHRIISSCQLLSPSTNKSSPLPPNLYRGQPWHGPCF
ncbi:hypothetical protein BJX62DRAFT_204017 [Aspergillus germanicus]